MKVSVFFAALLLGNIAMADSKGRIELQQKEDSSTVLYVTGAVAEELYDSMSDSLIDRRISVARKVGKTIECQDGSSQGTICVIRLKDNAKFGEIEPVGNRW